MPWIRIEGPLSPEEKRALQASDGLGAGLLAVFGAGFLALLATGLVVLYSSLPDELGIQVGLIGFFFVLFFDLFVIGFVSGAKIRQGQRRAALQLSVRWLLLGFPIALAAGALPWLVERLIRAVPWLLELLPWVWLVPLLVWTTWMRWRRPLSR